MSFYSFFLHTNLSELTKICELGSCKNLRSWNITIHTIESDIFWKHSLNISHKINQVLIIIRSESSTSPNPLKLRMWGNNHRIYLHLIWSKKWIIKYTSHTFSIILWCCSKKSWHNMCNDFESCIFKKSCSFY